MLKLNGSGALIDTFSMLIGYDTSSPTSSTVSVSTLPDALMWMYSLSLTAVDTSTSGTPTVYSVVSKNVWCASSVNMILSVSSCAG